MFCSIIIRLSEALCSGLEQKTICSLFSTRLNPVDHSDMTEKLLTVT